MRASRGCKALPSRQPIYDPHPSTLTGGEPLPELRMICRMNSAGVTPADAASPSISTLFWLSEPIGLPAPARAPPLRAIYSFRFMLIVFRRFLIIDFIILNARRDGQKLVVGQLMDAGVQIL